MVERNLRFQDWQTVGARTFEPDDLSEVVGSFSMAEDDDTLWVRITQLNNQPNGPWSYGILSWKTTNGFELGSTKAYGETESEVFRLGIGRPPFERTGQLVFEPRGFNLGWIKNGYPWTLKFEAASGRTSIYSSNVFPGFGPRATLGVFADLVRAGVTYAISEGFATVKLLPYK